jgi:hypothetical protein
LSFRAACIESQGKKMELFIVAKSGWSKSIETDEGVIRIGSASSNDIQLQSPTIAPVHIQILHPSKTDSSCTVVSLSDEITAKVSREVHRLPPCAAMDVHDGDEILLGDYSIILCLPSSSKVVKSARAIEAALSLPDAVLRTACTTAGTLTIKNTGEHSACQFQVEIEGLARDCFEIDPVPLLYSGGQDQVGIRIFHQISHPPAGLQTFALKVSAPEIYPGEEFMIRQDLYVAPAFEQALELLTS